MGPREAIGGVIQLKLVGGGHNAIFQHLDERPFASLPSGPGVRRLMPERSAKEALRHETSPSRWQAVSHHAGFADGGYAGHASLPLDAAATSDRTHFSENILPPPSK
jgi:hypothetical protein